VEESRNLFSKYIPDALLWLLIHAKSIVTTEDMMLDGNSNKNGTSSPEAIEVGFVYCAVWALGSSLGVSDEGINNKKKLSDWWRQEYKDVKFPSRDTVFDYWLDPETNSTTANNRFE